MQRWDKVLLKQGELLIMVSNIHHNGLLPPLRPRNAGALFMQWTPDRKPVNLLPNSTPLDLLSDPLLKNFLGTLEQQEVPTYG